MINVSWMHSNLRRPNAVLVEDVFRYTLPDFQRTGGSPGRRATTRIGREGEEPELIPYCEYFIRVLKAGFGSEKAITGTIFHDLDAQMPFRLVSFELGRPAERPISVAPVEAGPLLEEFARLDGQWRRSMRSSGSVYHARIARIYQSRDNVPTVFIIKPDLARYWTRSAGLSDADEVALDIFRWQRVMNHTEVPIG